MNHKIFLYILLSFFIFSCTPQKIGVRVPKPSHTQNAPEKQDGSYEINGERYYPIPSSSGFVQTGKASWYGGKFHGRRTSNGEIYDMHKKSAAHKILPFNTYVKVTNLDNKKSTIVRINDRGPFAKGRIIDLSYASAKDIGMVEPGTARVTIVALKRDQVSLNIQEGTFTVQVGAFSKKENAGKLADKLKVIYDYVNITEYVDEKNSRFYRLHVSKTHTLDNAIETEKKLEDMGFTEAFIVRL